MKDELQPEYDLAESVKDEVRGNHTDRYRAGVNLVRLVPEVTRLSDRRSGE